MLLNDYFFFRQNNIYIQVCTLFTLVDKSFRTPHAFIMYCIWLRICYLSAVTNIYTHAARELFRPAHNLMFQQEDASLQHIQSTITKRISFFKILLINNEQ